MAKMHTSPFLSSFLFLSFLLLLPFAHAQFTLPYNYNVSSADGYFLSWGFNEDYTAITVQVVLYQEAWVGICFHNGSETGMTNGDFVVASFGSNGELVSVDDRWAPTTQPPSLDNSTAGCVDNLISRSASQIRFQDSVQTVLTFQRLLNTGDICDVEIVNDTMNFSFAWGQGSAPSSNTFGNHGNNKGMFQLNLFNYTNPNTNSSSTYVPPPPSTNGYTWQGLHGTLMIFSFGFLMTLGTFLPRYLKEFWWWFPLHIIIQVSAVILSLVGFGIALVSVSSQFASVHTYFGAVTLILAFVSPFIGTASHFMWKPSRDRIPIFPDVIHWWVGRGALMLSYITILLGMWTITAPVEFAVGFVLLLLSYAFLFGFLDVIKIREVGLSQFFSLRTAQHATIQDEYKTVY